MRTWEEKKFSVIFSIIRKKKCFFMCEINWILFSFFKKENFRRISFFYVWNQFIYLVFFVVVVFLDVWNQVGNKFCWEIHWFIYLLMCETRLGKKIWWGDFLIFFGILILETWGCSVPPPHVLAVARGWTRTIFKRWNMEFI